MEPPAIEADPARPPREPQVLDLMRRAALRLGLELRVLDPEYGHLVALTDGDRTLTLLGGRSPLNDAVAARICEDKYYTGLVLGQAGFRVPASARCLKPGHFELEDYRDRAGKAPGADFVRRRGLPVIVKPNRLSHGRQIYVAHSQAELNFAIDQVWRYDYIALVQEPVLGTDLRLDYLDGKYLAGYMRTAGQQASTALAGAGGHSEIEILNLNRGARAQYITQPPPEWTDYCLRIADALNLRHFGVDLRAPALESGPASATVIEVNASPLLVQIDRLGFHDQALAGQAAVFKAALGARP